MKITQGFDLTCSQCGRRHPVTLDNPEGSLDAEKLIMCACGAATRIIDIWEGHEGNSVEVSAQTLHRLECAQQALLLIASEKWRLQ